MPFVCAAPADATSAAAAAATGEPAAQSRDRTVVESIYDGGLKNGWQDWGWGPRNVKGGGPATVRFDNWGGWMLAKQGLSGDFGGVVFRVKEPPGEGEFIEVRLETAGGSKLPKVKVKPDDRVDAGDGWVEVFIPMTALNPDGVPFEHVVIEAFRPMGQDFVAIDKVGLTKAQPRTVATYDTSTLPRTAIAVQCAARSTSISPGIYGIAAYAPNDAKRAAAQWHMGATGRRWGGNTTSTFNWEKGAWNLGSDWYYEDVEAPSYAQFVQEDADHGVLSVVTVPMMGWVAKDKTSFSFPVSTFGAQQQTDQWRKDAGNGKDKAGKPIAPGPPTGAYEPITPAFVKRWVEALRADDEKAGTRSVDMYILDNEPMLWTQNHRDVHPDALGYDELLQRTIEYGTAIREADPGALIAGPAEWGWTNYFYSAKDQAGGGPSTRPDRRAHGDVPLVVYYLRALADHERKTGTRVLDVLDLHAYPQGERTSTARTPTRRRPRCACGRRACSGTRRTSTSRGSTSRSS